MKLKKLRGQIDDIDKELTKLFSKRLKIVEQVGEYKEKNKIEILDGKREQEVFAKNLKYVDDERLLPYIQKFLQSNTDISKELQADKMKKY